LEPLSCNSFTFGTAEDLERGHCQPLVSQIPSTRFQPVCPETTPAEELAAKINLAHGIQRSSDEESHMGNFHGAGRTHAKIPSTLGLAKRRDPTPTKDLPPKINFRHDTSDSDDSSDEESPGVHGHGAGTTPMKTAAPRMVDSEMETASDQDNQVDEGLILGASRSMDVDTEMERESNSEHEAEDLILGAHKGVDVDIEMERESDVDNEVEEDSIPGASTGSGMEMESDTDNEVEEDSTPGASTGVDIDHGRRSHRAGISGSLGLTSTRKAIQEADRKVVIAPKPTRKAVSITGRAVSGIANKPKNKSRPRRPSQRTATNDEPKKRKREDTEDEIPQRRRHIHVIDLTVDLEEVPSAWHLIKPNG
jgi:hypothetical protein